MNIDISPHVDTIYFVLEYIGVLLAAIVGGTIAKKMDFDIVGFLFIALISSLAGGLLRDAMLSDGPAAALKNPGYLITAGIGAALAYFLTFAGRWWNVFRFYADVTTIGVWAVAGVTRAAELDLPWLACILLAVITATGGGMTRDVVIGRIPTLFTSQKMYVFPAVLAAALMLVFDRLDMIAEGMLVSAVAASVLAMSLYWFGPYEPAQQTDFRSIEAFRNSLVQVTGNRARNSEELVDTLDRASDGQFVAALRNLYREEAAEGAKESWDGEEKKARKRARQAA